MRHAIDDLHDGPAGPARRLLSGLAGLIGRGWALWATRHRRIEAIRQLNALDERMLQDIGLHRHEIERAVDGLVPRRQADR